MFEEQLEIIHRQMTDERFDFEGEHYQLVGCEARPKPLQSPRVPIVLGGRAGPRAARLAARYADEYNTTFPDIEAVRERKANIDAACADAGREPIPFSIMTGCLIGADETDVRDRAGRLKELSGAEGDLDRWLDGLRDAWIVGTIDQARSRLDDYAGAGVGRFMLQHQLHDDLDMVAVMGELVAG